MKLPTSTVLAIREECLAVSKHAMVLFDSLEDNQLSESGAKAASLMAGHAEGIRKALQALASANLMGMARGPQPPGIDPLASLDPTRPHHEHSSW